MQSNPSFTRFAGQQPPREVQPDALGLSDDFFCGGAPSSGSGKPDEWSDSGHVEDAPQGLQTVHR